MSKPSKSNIAVLLVCAGYFFFPPLAKSQYVEATIRLDAEKRSALVEGRFLSGDERRSLSFPLSAIGAPDLGQRISNMRLTDRGGGPVGSRRFGSAEYATDSAVAKIGRASCRERV